MATASITLTITDNAFVSLADVRDTLCTYWGYSGAANDNAAKIAFIKTKMIADLTDAYITAKKANAAVVATSTAQQIEVS